ncbi:hypothetical protein KKH15_00270 [Patescibacteria group bacterium]|nr:hypothetical protein [Patescibacteria group bacterium]MBU0801443.1 hypothetical protein [Alphaproteobacteria bacterium]MBU1754969.1 hypothetical protein [Patescibacteria group bacterium]
MKLSNLLPSVRIFGLLLATTLLGGTAFAQSAPGDTSYPVPNSGGSTKLVNPLKDIDSLDKLLLAFLDIVVNIGFIFLTLMIVYVGFLFVMAQGKDEKLVAARSALVWTIIGGLILLGAKAIALFIQATGAALGT